MEGRTKIIGTLNVNIEEQLDGVISTQVDIDSMSTNGLMQAWLGVTRIIAEKIEEANEES